MSPHAKSSLIFTVVALLLGVGLLARPSSLSAQVIKIEAGTSDILPSQGGSINIQGENYQGYVGAGDINGTFRFGSYLKTSLFGYKFTLGDQSTVIGLPTDIFGAQQYFLTRGAALSGQVHGAKVFLFGGATALGVGSQFFQAARTQVPVGMFFLDIPISDKLVFYSRNLGSRQQTSIQGLSWRPFKWLTTGVSGGIGGNQPYLATTLDVHRNWLDVKAGYISVGDRFRRITTPSIFAAEADRENILVTIKPVSSLVLIGGHQNLLQPQMDLNAPFLRASVDQFQANYNVAKFRLGAGLFQSRSQNFRNVGEDLSVSRPITRNIEAGMNYFQSLSGPGPHSSNLSGTIREKISQKLSLLQVVTRSQGNTNVLFGGSYAVNRFAVSVDYQTLYLPFLPSNPFSQSLSVSVRIKLFGNFQVNGDTFRSADGRLRYSAGASTLLVHNFQHGGSSNDTFNFSKYIVRGHVRDESGAPIEGAALRIADELVYSNAFGEFMARQKNAGQLRFEVVLPEFLNGLSFRVVAAPPTVTAEPEDSAHDVLVVLSPVFRPKGSAPLLPKPQSNPALPGIPVAASPQARGTVSADPKASDHSVSVVQGPVGSPKKTSQPLPPPQSNPASPSTPVTSSLQARGTVSADPKDSDHNVSVAQGPVGGPKKSPQPLPPPQSNPASPSTPVTPSLQARSGVNEIANILKYVVRGHVRDENGAPLAGVAILIGDEVVFTNATGEFSLRQKRPGLLPLAAAFEESANPRKFRVITAPSAVSASPEGSAHDVLIVLSPALPDKQS